MILEAKRKALEVYKAQLNSQQLKYENLLYKESYLTREIDSCRSLSVPSTRLIEQELGQPLLLDTFHEDISKLHDNIVQLLRQERIQRVEMKLELDAAVARLSAASDELDKKRWAPIFFMHETYSLLYVCRKFLDVELPGKVASLRTEATVACAAVDDHLFKDKEASLVDEDMDPSDLDHSAQQERIDDDLQVQ